MRKPIKSNWHAEDYRPPSAKRSGRIRWHRKDTIALLAIATIIACPSTYASDAGTDDQWNIMVVPSRQTVYSANARSLFNQNCARCHSKDGRAQTPIARQRHVQDLSECKLEDDGIIEQILEGTHNKTNSFKMPPFKEKLTMAEVQSLVPLVRAFRPLPEPLPNGGSDTNRSSIPRLVGIVNVDWQAFAVMESSRSPQRYFMLRENESHEGVKLLRIKPKKGTVRLDMGGTNTDVTLTLVGWESSHPGGKGFSGFLDRLGNAIHNNPEEVVLNGASTDLVLFLYAQFTGRTLIRYPHLPAEKFDLNFDAARTGRAASEMRAALRAKGITSIEVGDKFILVVPTSEKAAVKLLSSKIKPTAGDGSQPEIFPGGVYANFSNTELSQVVKLYADLTGRKLDPTPQLANSNATVNFTTQTQLTKDECVYALETLLSWHGLQVALTGEKHAKVVPIPNDEN